MIERVYIDNFRSFVNFEWRPGRLALLLGENGSGKTQMVNALAAIQDLVAFKGSTRQLFPAACRTRWDTRSEQTFELDLRTSRGLFRYRLVIELDASDGSKNRVGFESLVFEGRTLLEFVGGEIRPHRDDGTIGAPFPAPWQLSGVGLLAQTKDNLLLHEFKAGLDACWFLSPDPRRMGGEVEQEFDWLRRDMTNFATWYLRMVQQKPGTMFKAIQSLRQSLPGLEEIGLDPHDRRRLIASFDDPAPHALAFGEFSEGQRALIALHVVLHTLMVPDRTVVIDEPDNYLGLREIQPWLDQVIERCLAANGPQVWLISHHPEVLDPLAADHGWVFGRERQGPTRVEPYQPHPGLTPAESQARGWQDA